MAAVAARRAMQRTLAFVQHKIFQMSQASAVVLSPDLLSGNTTLLDNAIWLAAPKSKVTPSRKKIRNNDLSKRLKNIVHFQDCPLCGEKKLRHRLCMSCFKKGKYFL
ncbi:hypothetical protein PsorP6_005386 [Peronosclerospora sorghi]|uniref:Uncharacterized protein n=1 Tax=Peronosclerospora sorghi TaxID=230839 RepID=A0ACC0W4C3_9STRA|nr:hypothetical protein PsorP6_005386 [Peronosclerospora sorghi]